ncbi:MAG TPA: EamA family transporter [Lunatimonas sp.]|nr:EamA family transporter [Lunatimonas sp.]
MFGTPTPTKDYLTLHFVILIWSFTAILGVLISIPALEIVFYRTLIASLVIGLIFWVKKKSIRLKLRDQAKIIGTGFLISLHWTLFFWAAQVSNVSVCLVGMATCSLWTSFLEPLANKSKIKWYEVMLGLMVICGLVVIFKFEFDYWLGLAMALMSAFLCATFMVINGRLTKKHNPYTITFYEMVGAFVFSVLFMPIYASFLTPDGLDMQLKGLDWMWLIVLALVCTVFAFSMSVELMKRLTAFTINLTVNLEPVYGIILALIIFGEKEKMTPGFYLGTLIILGSVCLYPFIQVYYKRKLTKAALLN